MPRIQKKKKNAKSKFCSELQCWKFPREISVQRFDKATILMRFLQFAHFLYAFSRWADFSSRDRDGAGVSCAKIFITICVSLHYRHAVVHCTPLWDGWRVKRRGRIWMNRYLNVVQTVVMDVTCVFSLRVCVSKIFSSFRPADIIVYRILWNLNFCPIFLSDPKYPLSIYFDQLSSLNILVKGVFHWKTAFAL